MKISKTYKVNLKTQHRLTPKQVKRLAEIEHDAIARFSGYVPELESALGMLRLGHHYGWKVIYIIHSRATVKKYEKILDIKVRDEFKPEGPSSDRSIGYRFIKKLSNFWKAVSGESVKLDDKLYTD